MIMKKETVAEFVARGGKVKQAVAPQTAIPTLPKRQPLKLATGELKSTSACNACGAPIAWRSMTVSGKPVPLDPLPAKGSRFMLGEDGRLYTSNQLKSRPGLRRYQAHWGTCHPEGNLSSQIPDPIKRIRP